MDEQHEESPTSPMNLLPTPPGGEMGIVTVCLISIYELY